MHRFEDILSIGFLSVTNFQKYSFLLDSSCHALRYTPQTSVGQNELEEKEEERRNQECRIMLFIFMIFLHFRLCFFQFINSSINILQRFGIGGTEIESARRVCNLSREKLT